jgi:hypothetical protein
MFKYDEHIAATAFNQAIEMPASYRVTCVQWRDRVEFSDASKRIG